MIWWHRVGQKVVCVNNTKRVPYNDRPFSLDHKMPLVLGEEYTIKEIVEDPCHACIVFRLKEVTGQFYDIWKFENGWHPSRFKPVRETSIESHRELWLNPTPEQKRKVFQEMIEEKQRELVR